MFTGIIENKGKVLANHSKNGANYLIISAVFDALQTGESIAVNGVCLTLLSCAPGELHFDVSPETLKLTTLGSLIPGDSVNLERAMLASTRFGGHYVHGHVDTMLPIIALQTHGEFLEIELGGLTKQNMLYVIHKGSIAVDGVSLTINQLMDSSIKLLLVPHTLSQTSLDTAIVGQLVNIEFDYLTRIVAHQLQRAEKLNSEVIL